MERIGRVVLRVADLRDYDLRLEAADGSCQRVEVRGNQATEITHRFATGVPTRRLRLTALASQTGPGARGAGVRELEAYRDPGTGPVTPLLAR